MDVIEIHKRKISISAPFFWGTQERVDTAPKASGCILGGTQTFLCSLRRVWRGTGKAEDAKTPGAGIIPKLCPRKCVVEMEGGSIRPIGVRGRPELRTAARGTCSTRGHVGHGMSLSQARWAPVRAFLAESRPQGGPLLSQLGSAGQWARVMAGVRGRGRRIQRSRRRADVMGLTTR